MDAESSDYIQIGGLYFRILSEEEHERLREINGFRNGGYNMLPTSD